MTHPFIRRSAKWLLLPLFGCALVACDEDKPKTKIEPSKQMQQFLRSLNGTTERVNVNLERWSTEKGVLAHEIRLYPLANPTLLKHTIGTAGDCYHFEAAAHDTRRTYNMCWRDEKIVSVAFMGMQ